MKSTVLSMLVAVLILMVSMTAMAEIPTLRFSTGSENGVYNTILADAIIEQLQGQINVVKMPSKGSRHNVERLQGSDREADIAIAQRDVVELMGLNGIEDFGTVMFEYMHWVSTKKTHDKKDGIKEFKASETTVAIGPVGSGSNDSWLNIGKMDDKYLEYKTLPLGGDDAKRALRTGKVQAIFYVSGLGGGMTLMLSESQNNAIGNIDDWDFNDMRAADGGILYRFTEIDQSSGNDAYDWLMPGWYSEVTTIAVAANIIVAEEWLNEHSELSAALDSAVVQASMKMRDHFKQKDLFED